MPEVETIVRQLNAKVGGKTISSVEIYDPVVVEERIKAVLNIRITKVRRRAKAIIFELDNGKFLLAHLRMTGHFHYLPREHKNTDHQRFMVAKFIFSDGSFLTHNSIRRFGRIRLLDKKQLETELGKYGPEPLDLTAAQFSAALERKTRANVKTTLMDLRVIAGIGNIYAQEALYYSRISPLRSVGTLSKSEMNALHKNTQTVLQRAIEEQGCTVDNYSNLEGRGGFQNFLAVYGREKCLKSHPLTKITIGGRGTSYCPKCQR